MKTSNGSNRFFRNLKLSNANPEIISNNRNIMTTGNSPLKKMGLTKVAFAVMYGNIQLWLFVTLTPKKPK